MFEKHLIGEAMKLLRGERSQRSVADLAEIPYGTWSVWEHGKRMPREAQLEKIFHALGCSREDFIAVVWHLQGERFKLKGSELGPTATKILNEYQADAGTDLDFEEIPAHLRPVLLRLQKKISAAQTDLEALTVALRFTDRENESRAFRSTPTAPLAR